MSDAYTIRCPVCLQEMPVPKSTSVFKTFECEGCGSSFEFQDALPAPTEGRPLLSNTTIVENHTRLRNWLIIVSVPIVLAILIQGANYSNSLDGPSFLSFIIKIFLVTFIGSYLIRRFLLDLDQIRVIGFLIFESLCIYRLIWGYSHEMHKFGILFIAMIIGGFLYFLRFDSFQSQGSGGCGIGCGGGGGCGGGCGGCGGCGG